MGVTAPSFRPLWALNDGHMYGNHSTVVGDTQMITVSQNLSHCGADSGYPHKTRKLKAMVFSARYTPGTVLTS